MVSTRNALHKTERTNEDDHGAMRDVAANGRVENGTSSTHLAPSANGEASYGDTAYRLSGPELAINRSPQSAKEESDSDDAPEEEPLGTARARAQQALFQERDAHNAVSRARKSRRRTRGLAAEAAAKKRHAGDVSNHAAPLVLPDQVLARAADAAAKLEEDESRRIRESQLRNQSAAFAPRKKQRIVDGYEIVVGTVSRPSQSSGGGSSGRSAVEFLAKSFRRGSKNRVSAARAAQIRSKRSAIKQYKSAEQR